MTGFGSSRGGGVAKELDNFQEEALVMASSGDGSLEERLLLQ